MKKIAIISFIFLFVPFTHVRAAVVINEFLPNPSGDQSEDSEFIEIYNNGDSLVDISGWSLDDDSGGSNPYKIASGSSLAASEFKVYEKSVTTISLNNSGGDFVRLLGVTDEVVDSYAYTATTQDKSIGRSADGGGSFTLCQTITKGIANNCPLPTASPQSSQTPTKTPTKTPTQSPQHTNTIAPTINNTKTPTPKRSPSVTKTPTLEPTIDEITDTPQTSPTESSTLISDSPPNKTPPMVITLLFVGSGMALLAGVLVWQKKNALKNQSQ